MAYVVVLSTSQSYNSADTKWSPPTKVTPMRAAHHTPKGTLEYALYIRRNTEYNFLLVTNEREYAKEGKKSHIQ